MCWPMVCPSPLEMACGGMVTLKWVSGAATGVATGLSGLGAFADALVAVAAVLGTACAGLLEETELADMEAFRGFGHRAGSAVGTAIGAKTSLAVACGPERGLYQQATRTHGPFDRNRT